MNNPERVERPHATHAQLHGDLAQLGRLRDRLHVFDSEIDRRRPRNLPKRTWRREQEEQDGEVRQRGALSGGVRQLEARQ